MHLTGLDEEDVVRIPVTPGTWHLYFSGDEDDFARAFKPLDLDLPAALRPLFVLSPRPLALAPADQPQAA